MLNILNFFSKKKKNLGLLFFITYTTFFTNFNHAQLFFVKSDLKSQYSKINFYYKINRIEILNSEARLQIFLPYNFTNGMYKQFISNLEISMYPKIHYEKVILRDYLENEYLSITIKDKDLKNLKNDPEIQIQFTSYNEMEIPEINFLNGFPLNLSNEHFHAYLNHSYYTQKNKSMENLVVKLLKNVKFQEEVIFKIFHWLKTEVKLDSSIEYYDSISTFSHKKGNHKGILNLFLSLLRIAQIPARFVHGIALENEFILPRDLSKTQIPEKILSDKSIYYWLEIYFPYNDWLAFDFLMYTFFIPPYFIKKNLALDSESHIDFIQKFFEKSENKKNNSIYKEKIEYDIFYYINNPNLNFIDQHINIPHEKEYIFLPLFNDTLRKIIEDILLNPSLMTSEHSKIHKVNPSILNENEETSLIVSSLQPENLNLQNLNHDIQNKIFYDWERSQKIQIKQDLYLKAIELPLFYVNPSSKGLLWVEIYNENPKDKTLGKQIAKSQDLIIQNLNFEKNYQWINFPFPADTPNVINKNIDEKMDKGTTSPFLLKKNEKIWILLKRKSQNQKGILFWKGILGNPFQEKLDSLLFISSEKEKEVFYEYIDLCFRIIGTLIEK